MNFKTDDTQIIKLNDGVLWIKRVFDRLYVVNGYYIYFATDIDDILDDALASFVYRSKIISISDFNTDEGDVCFLSKIFNSHGELRYTDDRRDISIFDLNVLRKARNVLNEYRSWASNRN